jgi:hypothetical protein
MEQNAQVIIPSNHPNPPESHEVEAAQILAIHFSCVVIFLVPIDDYMRKTADILMKGLEWEIKSPIGTSMKYTIKEQFKRASKQAKNIIIDGRRTKLPDDFIEKAIKNELKTRRRINRALFITKSKKIIEIK